MRAMQETTVYEGDFPLHIYAMDGDKCHGYLREGTLDVQYFKQPITFDLRGRTFKEVKPSPFAVATPSTVVQVTGSKGAVYDVDPVAGTCSCPGFRFRGDCNHLKSLVK